MIILFASLSCITYKIWYVSHPLELNFCWFKSKYFQIGHSGFFLKVYISMNTIFECSYLSYGWKIGHPLTMYVTRGMEGDHPKCLQIRTGGEGYHASCVRTHLHYLFSCFCLMVSCFICRNLTLPSFKKGVFVRNGYFSPMRSISVVMK